MQRKYSEVVNYIPSFPAYDTRRNSRQPLESPKMPMRDSLQSTHSPTFHNHIQYQTLVKNGTTQNQSNLGRNASFQGQQRRSLPIHADRASLVNTVESPLLAQSRPSTSGYRAGQLGNPGIVPRRIHNPVSNMEQQHKFTSPQHMTRPLLGQFDTKFAQNYQPSADTSPIKLQQFRPAQQNTQSNIAQNVSPSTTRPGGRIYQSMIISDGSQTEASKGNNGQINGKSNERGDTYASQMLKGAVVGYGGTLESKARLVDSNRKARKGSEMWTSPDFKFPKNQLIYPPTKPESLLSLFKNQPKQQPVKQSKQTQQNKTQSQPKKQPQVPPSPVQFVSKFRKRTQSLSYNRVIQQPANKQISMDDFQIIQKLGKGAYGDVFLVRQKKTRFLCVLKSLSKKKIKQLGLEQHVFREIKIQSFLVHKHITGMYGVFDDQNKIYLIMQCMPDGSMASNGKKKISQSQTAYLIQQVCEGLLFMHREDILHRDIKPENLLLNNSYLKIGDFGCAVFGNTLRRTVVGCYAYISPEQFTNTPYDQKIDSWSVGVLAYQMLFGKPPHQEKLRQFAIDSHKNQNNVSLAETVDFPEVEFPKDAKVSTQAVQFIKRLLDKDPITRADIKQALKHKFLLKAKQFQKQLQSKM